ncbi:CPBP family intramembrane glutamic endopeptidase [Knoellia sp. p5-6-4]|uniref:CPBP family intramembrane glutamic endopeptidase n=1 Tax=unclassified Knoellia TaxID=2618719 RepID=UPI0023DB263A|nr:CPBP family intramembrane glutamic endopeptidase [Knoellia sp. p5-6-4]MDF2146528.1 lysostaphin resistance A-like protein [Knoellia sp. p5-6-4]
MTRTTPAEPPPPMGTERPESLARRRPVATFLLLALGIGWPVLVVPAIGGLPFEPFLLVLVYVALLGSALLVTRWADGPGAARRLLRRTLAWRVGVGRWAVVVLAMPVLTLAVAAVSGTLQDSERSWLASTGFYLFDILVFGALLLNLWEETAWGGFVQSRLMAGHGLFLGSLLTAPAFAAIHVPLLFEPGWTWSQVAGGLALLFGLAPVYRYLLGMHLLDTGGSVLVIAVQHASWNTATRMDEVDGSWQAVVAVVVLTVALAVHRRVRRSGRPTGVEAEEAAARTWLAPAAQVPGQH